MAAGWSRQSETECCVCANPTMRVDRGLRDLYPDDLGDRLKSSSVRARREKGRPKRDVVGERERKDWDVENRPSKRPDCSQAVRRQRSQAFE